jgi:hypothetical protein
VTAKQFVEWYNQLTEQEREAVANLDLCARDPNDSYLYSTGDRPSVGYCGKDGHQISSHYARDKVLVI